MATLTFAEFRQLKEKERKERAEARKAAKAAAKEAARIEAEKTQRPVKEMTITIEWKRSRTWGMNPHAEAEVRYHDGGFERSAIARASGCGYDKESTVIAELFNTYLKYKLWAMTAEQIKGGHGSMDKGPAPYGISVYSDGRYYSGGIGTSCYYGIAEYIGGKFERVANGKTFDVYKYTDGVQAE